MEGTKILERLIKMNWQFAEISNIITENYRTKTFQLIPQETLIFQPGNHIDVRLTSQNGYQTQRSYSISSHPEKKSFFEITVELIEDGEVSPYFFNEIIEGDKIEFRGPVGGPFKWTPQMGGPLLLLAGGSGIAPLRSMMIHCLSNVIWIVRQLTRHILERQIQFMIQLFQSLILVKLNIQ